MAQKKILEEKEKQEIKWIKTQRNIAILGLMASIFATSIQYWNAFYKYFSRASVTIKIEDSYLSKKSIVKIYSVTNARNAIIVGHPIEISEGISLDGGSYIVEIELNDQTLFRDQFYLKPKENRIFKIPLLFQGTISVYAKLNVLKVFPEMILPLIVESSKRGYLWIYDLKDGQPPKHIFPQFNSENLILPELEFILPKRGGEVITAGVSIGKEKLLFIVIEENDKAIADNIAINVSKSSLTKADSEILKNIYGVTTLSYNVELQ